jgi:integrase
VVRQGCGAAPKPSPSPWLFHWIKDKGKGKAGGRVDEFRTTWLKAINEAELPEGFRMHDLRHRRVTTWLAEGKDVVKVKEAVGHSALATTMLYTHLIRENLLTLVDEPKDEREGLKELAT